MNEFNSCIDTYSKTANNIYTLWGLVVLSFNQIVDINEFATKYATFMEGVQNLIDLQAPEEDGPLEGFEQHFKYYINSKGAATEPPQRKNRLESLTTILQNESNSVNRIRL